MTKKSYKQIENLVEYFPLGLAKHKAFCNRVNEQRILKQNIESITHTLIASPRRYGKSSLAVKVMEQSGLIYEKIDFFVAKDALTIEHHIMNGIKRLISQVVTVPEQAMQLIKTTLKHLNAKVLLNKSGISIEFGLSSEDPATNILDALQALDKILIKKKTRAILFIDEFQQISELAKGMAIEGAIRHVAQETRNIIFIFSGSNRHLLSDMFNDRTRPFYKLCRQITLDRISREDHTKFLNNVSHKAWGQALTEPLLMAIFQYTGRHPYYMNVLCSRIWSQNQKPTARAIKEIWKTYIDEEKSKTIAELDQLTANQYHILNAIAHGNTADLTGQEFLSFAKMSGSSVIKALHYLENRDYIQKNDKAYQIIDPLIRHSLLVFSDDF